MGERDTYLTRVEITGNRMPIIFSKDFDEKMSRSRDCSWRKCDVSEFALPQFPPLFLSPFLYPPDFHGDIEYLQCDGNKDF